MDLDFMPSPAPDRPGLLIRDPYRYSETTLIVPPALVQCLQLFNGEATELELREALVEITGDLRVGELQEHLVSSLAQAGFLDDETYQQMKAAQVEAFRVKARREAAHAGGAYPLEAEALRTTFGTYLDGAGTRQGGGSLIAIAAPHVSPDGGWECYHAAYSALGPDHRGRTFVVLGTSHYGEPDRFGLTRKSFDTPLGEAITDHSIVERLEHTGGPAVKTEDYCHAIEHSIEFQVVFLQHIFGPGIRIVPILCGPFARSLQEGGVPEQSEPVRQFFDALGELAASEGRKLLWVLGVDMAHMGRRYGDPFAARSEQGHMTGVREEDHRRIGHLAAGDAEGFWKAVQENRDALKWCGSAPFYTFLRAVPEARGKLLGYKQWNIDEQSVVSFGAMQFALE